jgi:hypothetical protein
MPSRRTLVALVAIVAAVLLAAAVTIQPHEAAERGSTDAHRTSPSSARALAEDLSGMAGGASATGADVRKVAPADVEMRDAAAPAQDAASTEVAPDVLVDPQLDSKIVRTGAIRMHVKRGRFEDAWTAAQSAATSRGGYVVSASRSGAGDDARSGTITMRVPTERFEAALDDLRDIEGAKVDGLDVSSQDVTQEYVDTKSRLRHDRAVEARLMTLLADADGVSEVLAVQARLDSVQEQIEVARGRLQYLDKLTAMSTIELALRAPAKDGSVDDSEPGTIATAFSDAGERFTENVAAAVVWVGGALPTLLVLALFAAIAWGAVRRRRRNSAPEQGLSE